MVSWNVQDMVVLETARIVVRECRPVPPLTTWTFLAHNKRVMSTIVRDIWYLSYFFSVESYQGKKEYTPYLLPHYADPTKWI